MSARKWRRCCIGYIVSSPWSAVVGRRTRGEGWDSHRGEGLRDGKTERRTGGRGRRGRSEEGRLTEPARAGGLPGLGEIVQVTSLRPVVLIGIAYLVFATWALTVSNLDPFFLTFLLPGALLLVGSWGSHGVAR